VIERQLFSRNLTNASGRGMLLAARFLVRYVAARSSWVSYFDEIDEIAISVTYAWHG
jgi:hypothetical protein